MITKHYTEVVSRSLYLWASGGDAKDEESALGLQAVFRVINKISYSDASIFAALYGGKKYVPFSKRVHEYATVHHIPEDTLWRRVREFEKKVAKEQGIL